MSVAENVAVSKRNK